MASGTTRPSRRFIKPLGILLAIVLAGYVFWLNYHREFHQRLTLVVDTPEGPKVGSSVTDFTVTFVYMIPIPCFGQCHPTSEYLTGEAVAVDLGPRGLLFCLLDRGGPDSAVMYQMALQLFGEDRRFQTPISITRSVPETYDLLIRLRPKFAVPFKKLPLLVRFRDINDPASVELVDPFDLAASFGAGVSLKSATFELADAPVTTGLEDRLPWLRELLKKPNERLGGYDNPVVEPFGNSKQNTFSNHLVAADFKL